MEIFDKIEKHLKSRFIYQTSMGSPAGADRGREKVPITPAHLSVLPVEWLQEFFLDANAAPVQILAIRAAIPKRMPPDELSTRQREHRRRDRVPESHALPHRRVIRPRRF
jgi:hypothetical protein